MRMIAVVAALLLATHSGSTAERASQVPRVAGIYSNLSFNSEGGDVLGIEILIVPSSRGYAVVFQSSEGEPAVPVVVLANLVGNKLTFTLPSDSSYAGAFVGTITAEGMEGSFAEGHKDPGGSPIIRLKRGKSYWQ
jgi:hypothetical protein